MLNDLTLILSLVSLGFFGGFSHCVGMCGPFVLTQVENRLQKIEIQNFSNFSRLKNMALLPYHLGRITTYSFIGFLCSFLSNNIQEITGFRILSAVFLILASLFFLKVFFEGSALRFAKIKLPFKSKTLKNAAQFFSKKTSGLFHDPQGLRGYVLGIVLGFIPCGLLYGAFLISASISQPFWAMIGMALFGVSTFPALFLTASAGYVFLKIPEFKFVVKAVLLINAATLFFMALKLID